MWAELPLPVVVDLDDELPEAAAPPEDATAGTTHTGKAAIATVTARART